MASVRPTPRCPSHFAVGLSLSVSLLACGGGANRPREPAALRPPSVASGPLFESPARFAYFPEAAEPSTFSRVLPDGKCLVLSEDGVRWLIDGISPELPCSGPARAAASISSEPLVLARKASNGFEFFASSGAMFFTREALGPFEKTVLPPVTLRAVAGNDSRVVGFDPHGQIHRFENSWRPLSGAGPTGRALDIAVDASGQAAVLTAPEGLWLSPAPDQAFKPLNSGLPPQGSWSLARQDQAILVRGVLGSLRLEGDKLVPATKHVPSDAEVVDVQPVRGPNADSITEGRAALFGRTYVEVTEAVGAPSVRFTAWHGTLGEPLAALSLVGTNGDLGQCEDVTVATNGRSIAVGCIRRNEQEQLRLDIYTSPLEKADPVKVAEFGIETLPDPRVALSADGTIMVTGACSDPDPADPKPEAEARDADRDLASALRGGRKSERRSADACEPAAPLLVRPGASAEIGFAQAPRLEPGSSRAPAFSTDGRFAYFLGRERSNSLLALFVSKDGGRTFAIAELRRPVAAHSEEDYVDAANEYLYVADGALVTVDETGMVGVLAEDEYGNFYATFDGEGRFRSAARPPAGTILVGGAGSRVLILGRDEEGADSLGWESLDGGISYSPLVLSEAPRRTVERGGGPIYCSVGGCVIGRELVRAGWEGQVEAQIGSFALPAVAAEVQLGAPIACQLAPDTSWTRVEGASEAPRLRSISRGRTAWSVMIHGSDGEVKVVEAPMVERASQKATLVTRSLLAPKKPAANQRVLQTALSQSEGFVAARAVAPAGAGGAIDTRKKVGSIEIAFINHYKNTLERRTITSTSDWSTGFAFGQAFAPKLLSIAGPGVVFQLADTQPGVFLHGGRETSLALPRWSEWITDRDGTSVVDVAFAKDRVLAVAFFDRPAHAHGVLAAPTSAGVKFEPRGTTLGGPFGEGEWLHWGPNAAIQALELEPEGRSLALGYPLQADGSLGEATPLPQIADLAGRLRPCGAEQTQDTPRRVAAHFTRRGVLASPEGRRPVLVSDTSSPALGALMMEPSWMLASGMVLHGTPKEPCVAGLHAASTRRTEVVVLTGDLSRGWMIRAPEAARPSSRTRPSVPRTQGNFEARPVICREQTDLPVPQEILAQSGRRMPLDQP